MKPALILLSIFLLSNLTGNIAFANSNQWSKFNSAGEAAYKRGDFAQAERSFRAALSEAQNSGQPGVELVFSLQRLAELYKLQGRNAEAEPLLKCALELKQQVQKRANHKANNAQSQKKSAARSGGGWDLNDLRINRRHAY